MLVSFVFFFTLAIYYYFFDDIVSDQSKATSDSISTSSSPFKVTCHDGNYIANTSQTTHNMKITYNSDMICLFILF